MTLETPIERMYRAGRQEIPDAARSVSRAANRVSTPTSVCNVQAAKAGDPGLMRDMLAVLGEVHTALRRATISLNGCAAAMVATADDFVANDDQARQDADALRDRLRHGDVPQAHVPPPIGDPAAPGATQEIWPDYLRPGIPLENQSHTVVHESTPGPQSTPEQDLEERNDAADEVRPDLPVVEVRDR